jgi:transposase
MAEMFGCAPSLATLAGMTRKIAEIIAPSLEDVVKALSGLRSRTSTRPVSGSPGSWPGSIRRPPGNSRWSPCTLSAAPRAWTPPGYCRRFARIACYDAWKPYDGYDSAAGRALCNAHLLRELTAVTETGTADDVIWARQAIDALLELKQASDAARAAGHRAIDAEVLESTAAGSATVLALNAARRSKLQRKRHAWRPGCATAGTTTCASPMTCGFLRQHEAQQIIRMSKLRIKVSGCMRSMTGIEAFCAIRSYLATAPATASPGSPTPHKPALQQSADHPGHTRDLSSYSRVSVSCNVTPERRRCRDEAPAGWVPSGTLRGGVRGNEKVPRVARSRWL